MTNFKRIQNKKIGQKAITLLSYSNFQSMNPSTAKKNVHSSLHVPSNLLEKLSIHSNKNNHRLFPGLCCLALFPTHHLVAPIFLPIHNPTSRKLRPISRMIATNRNPRQIPWRRMHPVRQSRRKNHVLPLLGHNSVRVIERRHRTPRVGKRQRPTLRRNREVERPCECRAAMGVHIVVGASVLHRSPAVLTPAAGRAPFRPFQGPSLQGFALVVDVWNSRFLRELLAAEHERLPDDVQGACFDRVAELVIEELFVYWRTC